MHIRSKEIAIGLEQIPKSMIAALGKMPGSEGNQGQTAKHTKYCVHVARSAPSCDAVRHKCSVMHSGREPNFTEAELS